MGLKQSIVVVNEYTVPTPGGGSRGGTPGDYVTRYMARDLATEAIAPIRRYRTQDYIERYMAREDATEALGTTDPASLKRGMARAAGLGGVAFGYGDPSLSHDQLIAASGDVQRLFDQGHTVMKTVISFEHDYLASHALLTPGLAEPARGGYRGELDQMKLRLAVMAGLERMGSGYDDLRYVGVIQVDTEHVHCHLAMVDAGAGTLAADGTQRGKLGEAAKSTLRRGTDAYLDEKSKVAHLSSAVGYERRNVTTYVKRWAHQQMLRESLPQFLLASLPADRRMWRLGTNHAAMAKPNRVVRELVSDVLSEEGSPMSGAMAAVSDYAQQRADTETLSAREQQQLIDTGRERILERGVNAVYGLLRSLPQDVLEVQTGMLDAMGMDYQEMAVAAAAEDDDMLGFGYRLRSYSSRLEHHSNAREENHRQARRWESADAVGAAAIGSRVLYDFWLIEEQYHARAAAKYRRFLSFAPAGDGWYEPWREVVAYGDRVASLEAMRADHSLRAISDPDEAERLGQEAYGQPGGHLVAAGDDGSKAVLESRAAAMRERYAAMVVDLRVELAGRGLVLEVNEDEQGRDEASIVPGAEHPFAEVKGLDLHHLRYDFARDVPVGAPATSAFLAAAQERGEALAGAVAYLEGSGQGEEVSDLPVADVLAMNRLAASMEVAPDGSSMLRSEVARLSAGAGTLPRSKASSLAGHLSVEVSRRVQDAVAEPGLE